MKKISISLLTFCSVFAMTLFPIDVHAIDFEGKEDQYIKICSSNLTNSNKKTCQEFNKYLKEKNQDLKEDQKEESKELDIVAVTACPTGIAHTYIAEKALIEKAKEMNISIKVETNGASGIQNTLTKEDIQKARCVIVAADKNTYNSNCISCFINRSS